jgi:hypothetical protein
MYYIYTMYNNVKYILCKTFMFSFFFLFFFILNFFSFIFCQFGSIDIDLITIHPNCYLSLCDDKSNLYQQSYFYSFLLVISEKLLIVDNEVKIISIVLNDIMLLQLLHQLELVASQHRDTVIHKLLISDIKKVYATVIFGSYID